MTQLKYVFDGTAENFQQLVLGNSHKGLVLVNYWTPKAGPCFKLWEALGALSEEYQGRFLLVNVNTEVQANLARDNGITSVPTVKLFLKGTVVDAIHGAQSTQSLRAVIDRHLPPAPGTAVAEALRAYQAGRPDEALERLATASREAPNDPTLHTLTIKLLFREHRFEAVAEYYAGLPDEARANPDLKHLVIHAGLLKRTEQVPPTEELDQQLRNHPDDQETLLTRAAIALVQDDQEHALECLLTSFQLDRHYREGFAHQAMLSLFALLGSGHELTRRFQQRMREALH